MNEWYREKREYMHVLGKDYGKLILVCILLVASAMSAFALMELISPKKLRVSFLDVGQGDSILIQTPSGHDMLVDGGAHGVVLERLASKLSYFDRHLDVVVATHPDADHITGLIPVLEKYTIDHVVTSPVRGHTGISGELEKSIEYENAITHVAVRGDEMDFGDGVVAHILYPGDNFHGNEKDTNDASVSMVITYGDESVLLTGDLPSQYEGKLLSDALPHGVTIYKAGHHGSKYSSGDVLLSYIKPEYSVISAGKDNKYGHPNPEAVGRLKVYSKEILSTIDRGTITFTLDGSTADVTTSK